MKLHARAFGLAAGTVWGLAVFVATIWAAIQGRGELLFYLERYYFGYRISFVGAIVGLLWGFANGFIAGALIAWLYNAFHKSIYKSDTGGI